VANEVKELAKETAKATEDISFKIEAIQADTTSAVGAIGKIASIIGQINEIQTTIAGAVEEQTATTNEMSRNISEGARGTNEIATSITGVAKAAQETSAGTARSTGRHRAGAHGGGPPAPHRQVPGRVTKKDPPMLTRASRAIIVDDSRATRTILRRTLTEEGFEVIEAGDGQQALDQLTQAGALDLALVDWNMPVMNGLELIGQLRARSEFDGMAIMMVTTETEIHQVQRALDAGANEYVMKPFDREALEQKLMLLGLVV
jgi:two-component system chemotaxis response regulator CheY